MRILILCQFLFVIAVFISTIRTIMSLVIFLSQQNNAESIENGKNKFQNSESFVRPLLWNLFYTYLFIFQHSIMATKIGKEIWIKIGFEVIQRSIYVACSSFSLSLLMANWQRLEYGSLWVFDTEQNRNVWWAITLMQFFGWMIVLGGCVMMDLGEMLGLKQVWNCYRGRADPMTKKSKELQSLYSHTRHPSLNGFLVIFWIHPHMTLDRCVLAILLSAYMLGFFTMDNDDYAYQYNQLIRKRGNYISPHMSHWLKLN
uniref:Nuclear envelope membrane protein n=1 Tax=Strigamia maritima TaxID=126957 RepID=T1JED3_STRMM